MTARKLVSLLATLLAVALLAWFPRSVEGLKHPYEGGTSWFSRDPDGLYHARRVERALREGSVAESDARMNSPQGARIPWPPYYDLVLSKALAPFAPKSEDARWRWIERATSSAPRLFGVATAVLAAFAAWRISGLATAFVAGATIALCRGTINYSVIGTGDHHAWISMLAALSLFVLAEAFRREVLASRGKSAALGVLLGLLAGLMIGSWVAALLYLAELQIALGWLLFRRARESLPGVAPLGFALHATAALVLLPAVLSSPWRAEFPWMVVNLSWFHVAVLALGAAVFAPLLALESRSLAPGTRAAKLYPFGVAAALAALALACWAFDFAPARGIAEGFAWVSRADRFMDTIQESAPLVGPRAESIPASIPGFDLRPHVPVLFFALGFGVLALPVAWALAAWRALRKNDYVLLPWLVAVAWLLPQALAQRRFADALAAPMAVVLAWGASQWIERKSPRVVAPICAALALLAQWPSASAAWRGLDGSERARWVGTKADVAQGERMAFEWIRSQPVRAEDEGVLAHWDRGHVIEWAADRASVADNFGSYIGVESYRDPPAFFLDERPSHAFEVLERRHVRYVYVPASILNVVGSMCRVLDPALAGRYLEATANGGRSVTSRFYATLAGRLLVGGEPVDPSGETVGEETGRIEYLRLVYVTPQRDQNFIEPVTGLPFPAGMVWERVRGALVEARGQSGQELSLEFDVAFADARYRLPWRAHVAAGQDGVARLRVPFATLSGNGQGEAQNARWRFGRVEGTLAISEEAVESGATVLLDAR